MKQTILLLSGTSEGPLLARGLSEAGFRVRATVTRPEAPANLFGSVPEDVSVEVRGFTEDSLSDFLRSGAVDLVLDATHPFAVRITRIAHGACMRAGAAYIRYERPDWEPPEGTLQTAGYAEAAALLPSLGSCAMLTIGSKQLKHFAPLHGRMRLYARILPSVVSLQQAAEAGFTREKVLCLRPPFSQSFNRAIFQEYAAEVLVTKASGREGGVAEKVLAAKELGMEVLMIQRPEQEDVPSVSTVAEAIALCREKLARK